MVRAKVALLRAAQAGSGADASRTESRGYLRLASKYGEPAAAGTHRDLRALRLRQDDDFPGAAGGDRSRSRPLRRRAQDAPWRGSARAIGRARRARALRAGGERRDFQERLRSTARDILDAGRVRSSTPRSFRRSQRESFRALAAELRVPFVILAFEAEGSDAAGARHAPAGRGRRRVGRRPCGARTPIATREPLSAEENACAVTYDARGAARSSPRTGRVGRACTPARRLSELL